MATTRRSKPKTLKCSNNSQEKGSPLSSHQYAVVWEWQSENGLWKPYSAALSHLLERASSKGLVSAYLGDADPALGVYIVNFSSMQQQNQNNPGAKCHSVRRQLYPSDSLAASGFRWVWCGDAQNDWHCFTMDVQCYLEDSFQKKMISIDLEERFPHLSYGIDFSSMTQVNKVSGYKRRIQRVQSPLYPVDVAIVENARTNPDGSEAQNSDTLPVRLNVSGASASNLSTAKEELTNCPARNLRSHDRRNSATRQDSVDTTKKHLISSSANEDTASASQKNKKPKSSKARSVVDRLASPARALASLLLMSSNRASKGVSDQVSESFRARPSPYIQSDKRSVPGVKRPEKICVATKDSLGAVDVDYVIHKYTSRVDNVPDEEDCCICCERLSSSSAYGEDEDRTVVLLRLCSHYFHQSCLKAMYNAGLKDGCIQCPTCKLIHGIKFGNQPDGRMDYYVETCSLPDYSNCWTICITYFIAPGIQGAEHPDPGAPYTARGFPRRCYLPDNDDGRKVLGLLITAWERRLIFTVGPSSTTGEENTVTWNEIHHKTEFGSNWSGHGFPDPHYIPNVLQELALQGVVE